MRMQSRQLPLKTVYHVDLPTAALATRVHNVHLYDYLKNGGPVHQRLV